MRIRRSSGSVGERAGQPARSTRTDATGDAVNGLDDAGGGYSPSRVNRAKNEKGEVRQMENDGSPEFRGFVAAKDLMPNFGQIGFGIPRHFAC